MNISLETLQWAALNGYNYTNDTYPVFFDLATQMFNISSTETPSKTFNLHDLARHLTIEQDGSLSRNDLFLGDDLHFDPTVWAPVAKNLDLYQKESNDPYVTVDLAAKVYIARQEEARRVNLNFTYDFF